MRGRLYGGECCFLALKGIIRGLLVSIHLKENLPIVNIKLLITHNLKDKLKHLL